MKPTALLLLLALAACTESPTEPAPMNGPIPAGQPDPDHERFRMDGISPNGMIRVPVQGFENPQAIFGSSRLARGVNGVRFDLRAEDQPAGSAMTLWVVIFNRPDRCGGECGEDDLFGNPDAEADLLYADGDVVSNRGRGQFRGSVAFHDASASIMPLFGLPARGLVSETAEIHLVVRDHGPVLPDLRAAQLTTLNGGCTGMGPEFGTPGPNLCVDAAFAVHRFPKRAEE